MIDRIRDCMKTALKLDEATASSIDEFTTAADIKGWTSVGHLAFILELEKAFAVTFDDEEIVHMGSVAAVTERLKRRSVHTV